MTSFSASDVALEGFRITRENPRTVAIWSGFLLVVSIVSGLMAIGMGPEARAAIEVINGQEAPDPSVLAKALEALIPLLILGVVVQCVMATAVYRVVLRHSDHGFGYLKLGMDEVRLALLTVIYILLGIVALVGISIAAALVMVAAMAVNKSLGVLVGSMVELFSMGLLLYVAIRLSLAPAITFAEKRLAVFDSWQITRGHFWRLLGAYVLAVASMVVVAFLALTIFMAIAAIATGGDLASAGTVLNPDQSSLQSYFTPLMVAYLVFAALLTAIYYPVIISPAAMAYQALSGRPEDAPDGIKT